MSVHGLQPRERPHDGLPVGDMFRLHKDKCGQQLEAVCQVVTHPLGWELRLEVAGSLQRVQVCRSQDEVLDTSERWKAQMTDAGWV
jgi:GTP cyclohydrolase II